MLRFLARAGDRTIVGLGLTSENFRRLQEGEPILVDLGEMGTEGPASDVKVFVYHGPTEESLTRQLEDAGLVGPETERHVDPRLGFE